MSKYSSRGLHLIKFESTKNVEQQGREVTFCGRAGIDVSLKNS
jgi:hypothetical protein